MTHCVKKLCHFSKEIPPGASGELQKGHWEPLVGKVDDLTHRSGEFSSAGCGTRVVEQMWKSTLVEWLKQELLNKNLRASLFVIRQK